MTKTLSMASHKNHNLGANEGSIIFLTSKLLLIYSMEVNICIGFWTLKVKCTQYEICG